MPCFWARKSRLEVNRAHKSRPPLQGTSYYEQRARSTSHEREVRFYACPSSLARPFGRPFLSRERSALEVAQHLNNRVSVTAFPCFSRFNFPRIETWIGTWKTRFGKIFFTQRNHDFRQLFQPFACVGCGLTWKQINLRNIYLQKTLLIIAWLVKTS